MLRVATWPCHQRLEKRLDVKRRFATRPAYRAHLARLHGFCVALETHIPSDAFGAALPDYPARRRLGRLAGDLEALGIDAATRAALPACPDLPAAESVAAAFGCVYVIEGATLGGRTLLPLIERDLGLDADHGAAFLAGYGPDTDRMWRRFCSALEAWCHDDARRAEAAVAATATFAALERWLCREDA